MWESHGTESHQTRNSYGKDILLIEMTPRTQISLQYDIQKNFPYFHIIDLSKLIQNSLTRFY